MHLLVDLMNIRKCTVCCPGWIGSNPTRTTDSQLERTISTNCCINPVVPPDDRPR